jgi:hypothetical protein
MPAIDSRIAAATINGPYIGGGSLSSGALCNWARPEHCTCRKRRQLRSPPKRPGQPALGGRRLTFLDLAAPGTAAGVVA